ncbi:MAG: hypothetical protein AAGH79_10900, partial [Bacteroidota bacterium]
FKSSLEPVIGVNIPFSILPGKSFSVIQELPGWQIGANYYHTIGSGRFGLRAGSRIYLENERIDSSDVIWPSQTNAVGGFDPNQPSGEEVFTIQYNRISIGFPIAGRLYFGEGKWRGFAELGVISRIFLTNRMVLIYGNGDRNVSWGSLTLVNTTNVGFIALAGGGVEFQAKERLAFFATLLGRYVTNTILRRSLIKGWHIGNVGLEMGARFSLK